MAQRGRSARETQEDIQAAHSRLAGGRARFSIHIFGIPAWSFLVFIVLISLSVGVSAFITYRMTDTISSNLGELTQNVETLTRRVNDDMLPQLGALQEEVNAISDESGTATPQMYFNVLFKCVDAATKEVLPDCTLHLRIQNFTILREYDVAAPNQTRIPIRERRQLEITAEKDGYKTTTEIFEYIEDGSIQTHEVVLEKANP